MRRNRCMLILSMWVGVSRRLAAPLAASFVALLPVFLCFAADNVAISGHVEDENNTPVAGVRIVIRSSPSANPSAEATSGASGDFSISIAPGHWLLSAEHEGFFPIHNQSLDVAEGDRAIDLAIAHITQNSESVTVDATAPGVDIRDTTSSER